MPRLGLLVYAFHEPKYVIKNVSFFLLCLLNQLSALDYPILNKWNSFRSFVLLSQTSENRLSTYYAGILLVMKRLDVRAMLA